LSNAKIINLVIRKFSEHIVHQTQLSLFRISSYRPPAHSHRAYQFSLFDFMASHPRSRRKGVGYAKWFYCISGCVL